MAVLMANHYAIRGREITLLSVGKPEENFRFAIEPAVEVAYLNIFLGNRAKLIRKLQAFWAARNYFQKQKLMPDKNGPVVLLAIGNFPIILASLLSGNSQLKRIGCLHFPYKSIIHFWKFLRWLCYRRMDVLVSLTHRDVPQLQKHHPIVKVIPNPVSFFPDQPAKLNNKLLLAVGRIDYPKGYDLMIEAFGLFCQKNSGWQLKIIGDGPSKPMIERVAKEKGIDTRITFSPATDQIEQEYLAASIFLMTSRSEGLPMVLLEAQACGLPIVAFDCETGPAEIIHHGEDGYLIPPNNFGEMSDRLLELAADFDRRKAFGAKARENVKRFLPDEIFKQWDELIEGES